MDVRGAALQRSGPLRTSGHRSHQPRLPSRAAIAAKTVPPKGAHQRVGGRVAVLAHDPKIGKGRALTARLQMDLRHAAGTTGGPLVSPRDPWEIVYMAP